MVARSRVQSLPRDGLVQLVRLATYDPRVGRFSGLQISSTLRSGEFVHQSTLRGTVKPYRSLAERTPSPSSGQPTLETILSGTASGPLRYDAWRYSGSAQVRHVRAEVQPLDALGERASAAVGLTAGERLQLSEAAQALGLPWLGGAERLRQDVTDWSAIGRFDLTPNASALGDPSRKVAYFLASASGTRRENQSVGPTTAASQATQQRSSDAFSLFHLSASIASALVEFKSRASVNHVNSAPGSLLPSVLIAGFGSALPAIPLRMGGSSGGSVQDRTASWESSMDATWRSHSRRHLYNVFGQLDLQSRRSVPEPRAPVDVLFDTRDAFLNRSPTRLTIGPVQPSWRAGSAAGAVAISDVLTFSDRTRPDLAGGLPGLVVQWGLRAEADILGSVARSVDESGRIARGTLHRNALLPMLGFTWRSGAFIDRAGGVSMQQYRSAIEGGVRVYRGALSTGDAGTLPSALFAGPPGLRTDCIGTAVPDVNWRAIAAGLDAGPTQCRPGAPSTSAATVTSYAIAADDLDAARSSRAEIGWSWMQRPSLRWRVGATRIWNARQLWFTDRNFSDTPSFSLAQENDRLVYAPAPAIDQQTGAIAGVGARRDPELGQVIEYGSRGSSVLSQFTAAVMWHPWETIVPHSHRTTA